MKTNHSKYVFLIIPFFIFFLFLPYNLLSKANQLDSLINAANTYQKGDSTEVNLLTSTVKMIATSHPEQAKLFANRAIELSKQLNNKQLLAKSYNAMGFCLRSNSDFNEAINYLFKALKINEELGNEEEIAKNYGNIGLIYLEMNDFEKAEKYALLALPIFQKHQTKPALATIYGNLGIIYKEKKDYTKALQQFTEALKLDNELNNKAGIIRHLTNIGSLNVLINKQDKAISNLEQALQLSKEIEDYRSQSIALGNLGHIYYLKATDTTEKKNRSKEKIDEYLNKSISLSSEAVKIAQELNFPDLIAMFSETLAKAYKEKGNYKLALNYFELHRSVNDSLLTIEKAKEIANLEAIKENEVKAKEIVILQQKNKINRDQVLLMTIVVIFSTIISLVFIRLSSTRKKHNIELETKNKIIQEAKIELETLLDNISEQKQQIEIAYYNVNVLNKELEQSNETINRNNVELKELNATKDKLFSIIAHDLRNPLQSLITNSEILINFYDKLEPEIIRSKNVQILESSKLLVSLLENLLTWSRTQLGRIQNVPENVNLQDLLQVTLHIVQPIAEQKSIKLNYDLKDNCKVYADPNMVNTIFRNLITNAIKFSHTNSNVFIKCDELDDKYVHITIEDNGVGISEEDLNKLLRQDYFYSSKGTMNEQGTGLGLILCKEFIEKNQGKIWIESELGKGTKVHFTLLKNND
jgi:signal transduction histidine kinase/tetratricopeptide (TPR) repeat protein